MLSQFSKISPLLNRIVIKRIEAPTHSVGGIILPESKEEMQIGEVISCGPGFHDDKGTFIKVSLTPGQKVLLPPYGGTPVEFKEEKFSIYKDTEILALLE